jgi:hypothetical protein
MRLFKPIGITSDSGATFYMHSLEVVSIIRSQYLLNVGKRFISLNGSNTYLTLTII